MWFVFVFSLSVSPCLSSPCLNEGTCVETSDGSGYICNCAEGFEGKDCEIFKTPSDGGLGKWKNHIQIIFRKILYYDNIKQQLALVWLWCNNAML